MNTLLREMFGRKLMERLLLQGTTCCTQGELVVAKSARNVADKFLRQVRKPRRHDGGVCKILRLIEECVLRVVLCETVGYRRTSRSDGDVVGRIARLAKQTRVNNV
jgi:hypothetical protein